MCGLLYTYQKKSKVYGGVYSIQRTRRFSGCLDIGKEHIKKYAKTKFVRAIIENSIFRKFVEVQKNKHYLVK